MIYLIQYDRPLGQVMVMTPFADQDRQRAEDARLEIELSRKGQQDQLEVVLLEASSEEALRGTHRRYFESIVQLAQSSATSTG